MHDNRSTPPGITANEHVRFQLTADISGTVPNRKATGKIRLYISNDYALVTDEIDFYDAIGDLTGETGDKGYAIFFRDSGRYEILSIEC
jgi:hypothetical protein